MSEPVDPRRNSANRGDDPINHGEYEPGAVNDVVEPPADPFSEEKRQDPYDPADARVDPEVLRNGGPTRAGGAVTTTGGTAGRASVRRVARRGRDVAPTTTGGAETGGMQTPARGNMTDTNTPAPTSGVFTDE
ncbi:hypothetical protein [Micromonospora pattaloongensis]|uniref:hypothetical protein n=1 Tax=Micromonospora pattaloongensis TaxID=405436 RepID=UPI003CCBD930